MHRYAIPCISLLLLISCAPKTKKNKTPSPEEGASNGITSIFAPGDLNVPANLTQLDKTALTAELSEQFAVTSSSKAQAATFGCFDRINKDPAVATKHTVILRTSGTVKNCDISNANSAAPTVIRSANVTMQSYISCYSRDLSIYDGTIVKSERDINCPKEDMILLSEVAFKVEYGVTYQNKEYHGELDAKSQIATKDGKPCVVAEAGSCIETHISIATAFRDAIGKLLDPSLKDKTVYSQYITRDAKKINAKSSFAFDSGSAEFTINQWQHGAIEFNASGASWSADANGKKDSGALTLGTSALIDVELPSIQGAPRLQHLLTPQS